MKIGICWHCNRISFRLEPILMTARKYPDETHEVNVCKFCKKLLVHAPKSEPKPEPDIFVEIEALLHKIKESDIMASQFEEEREIIASNLMLCYYMAKLERKMK